MPERYRNFSVRMWARAGVNIPNGQHVGIDFSQKLRNEKVLQAKEGDLIINTFQEILPFDQEGFVRLLFEVRLPLFMTIYDFCSVLEEVMINQGIREMYDISIESRNKYILNYLT